MVGDIRRECRPEIADAIETVLESDFVRVAAQLDRLKVPIQAAGFESVNFFNEPICRIYADCLCTVIDFAESSTREQLGVFTVADWENPFFQDRVRAYARC